MKKTACFILSIFSILCIVRTPVNADWINLSGAENAPNIAEIHINEDHVRVDLEIFVNDIVTFDRLIPDSFFKVAVAKPAAMAPRMTDTDAVPFWTVCSKTSIGLLISGKKKTSTTGWPPASAETCFRKSICRTENPWW